MNPIHIHLLLNHVPVIGALLGVGLLGYAMMRQSPELIRASLGVLLLAAVVSVIVFLTGEPAEAAVKQAAIIEDAVLERHEAAALVSMLLLGGVGLFALAGLLVYRRRASGIPMGFAAIAFLVALVPTAAMGYTANLGGQIRHAEVRPTSGSQSGEEAPALAIPAAMQSEHEALHAALEEATYMPGRVGEAARAVADVLHPHFQREEQIALPPLGLLVQLSRQSAGAEMERVLPLTDALKAELPKMLQEHAAIAAAVARLAEAARAENLPEAAQLAERIRQHAQTEEQVTYPAAILVGEYVRLSRSRHD